MNAALIESLIEKAEAHDVGNRAIGSSDLEFLWSQFFMQIKISDAKQLSVNLGRLLARCYSNFLIAVGIVIHLHQLSDESASGVCGVHTCIQGLVGLIVTKGGTSESLEISKSRVSVCVVEHIL
jgi:hypothetical protein